MTRLGVTVLIVALAVMLPTTLAVAQNPPSLPPGTPLPPGFQLPPGWTYDQATGQFRPASTPAAPAPAAPSQPAATCADLRTQTTTLEHDAQGLQRQAQDALNRLHDTQRKLADAQKQRDLICAATPGVAGGAPAAKSVRLPLAAIAPYFTAALQGTQVRLHNYQGQASWVQFGPALGNLRVPVNVPEGTFTLGAPIPATGHYWVNDVRSRRAALDLSGGRLVLTVDFQNSGREIIIAPLPGIPSPPAVGTSNAQVVATITPGLDGSGRPSFGAVAAKASGDLACTGGGILGSFCNAFIPTARPYIQQQIESSVQNALGNADVKNRIGAAVRAALDSADGKQKIQAAAGAAIGKITATRFAGSDLIVEYQ